MSKTSRFFTIVFLPILTLALGWQIGMMTEQQRLETQFDRLRLLFSGTANRSSVIDDPEAEVNISLLWAVWRLLQHNYIDPSDLQTDTMLFGAVSGLVDAVGDPYTLFMTPKENADFFQTLEGKLEGIGIQITMRDGQVVVIAPLKGSPAAKAGFASEDIVVEVDSVDVRSETLDEVVQRIRGAAGTEVVVGVRRAEEPDIIRIPVVRGEITIPNVEWEHIERDEGSLGYISLNRFAETTVQEVNTAISELQKQNVAGLILDLRYNGGGLLDGAVRLSSQFLTHGKVVSVHRRNAPPENHYVYGTPIAPDIPMAVLINEGSASASEIVAGALRDHDRATLLGATTFGKGTVQEIIDLPGGSSLRVTTSQWHTPDGFDLGEAGIEPDIVVEQDPADIELEIDTQREAAVRYLLGIEEIEKFSATGAVLESLDSAEDSN